MKAILKPLLISLFSITIAFSQDIGDYRTNQSGDWEDASIWEVFDGESWSFNESTPSSADNVYISHLVNLTQNESCKNLKLSVDASNVIKTNNFSLSISGSIAAFTGETAPGVNSTAVPRSNTWINTSGGGKLVFVGGSRAVTINGSWQRNPYGWNVEFALNPDAIVTLATNFMAGNITISSGGLQVTGNVYLMPDNGSAGTGNLTINTGAILMLTNGPVQRQITNTPNNTSHFGTLTNNGTIELSGTTSIIGASTIINNGTVDYRKENNQIFIHKGPNNLAANFTSYKNLVISKFGTKTLSSNITLNDTLCIKERGIFLDSSFSINYASSASVVFNNAAAYSNTDDLFPTANGPKNIVINTSANTNVALQSSRSITGNLYLLNGRIVTSSSSNLTLLSANSIIGGNSASFIDGPINFNLNNTVNTIFLPIGRNSIYRPVNLSLNQTSATDNIYTFEMINAAAPNFSLPNDITAVSNIRHYFSSKISGSASITNVSVTLSYSDDDLVSDNFSLDIAKDDGGEGWVNLEGDGIGLPSGTITNSIAINTLGYFVLCNATLSATTGDYRTISSGNFASKNIWQVYNGNAWVAASTAPTSTTNVFIQNGHTVFLSVGSNCNDLNLAVGSGSETRLQIGSYILRVHGKIRAFKGLAPGTDTIAPGTNGTFITTTTGELRFVGTSRNITEVGQWGPGVYGFNCGFNLTAGNTATLNTHFRAGQITVYSGTTLNMNPAISAYLALRATTGTGGTGSIIFNSGSTYKTVSTTVSMNQSYADNTHIGTFTMNGTWIIDGTNTVVAASNVTLGGTIIYNSITGTTPKFINRGSMLTGTQIPDTYNNVTVKSLGKLTLMSDITINGVLNMNSTGGVISLLDYNLALGASASVTGSFNANNCIITDGLGEVRKTFNATDSFTFPTGDWSSTKEYSPITAIVNAGSFPGYVAIQCHDKKPLNTTNSTYISRYFNFNTTIGSPDVNINANYVNADYMGTKANIATAYYTNAWNFTNCSLDTINNIMSVISIPNNALISGKLNNNFNRIKVSDEIETTLSKEEKLSSNQILIWPNPFENEINISNANNVLYDIKLVDNLGRIVLQESNNSQNLKLSTTELKNGVYYLIISNQTETLKYKIIK